MKKRKQLAILFNCILNAYTTVSQLQNFHGVKSNRMCAENSCITMEKTKSLLKCFTRCMNTPSVQCISYSKTLQTCMCCNNSFGDDVTSTGWESYVPNLCQAGYVNYNYTDFQICLKYVPDSVRYSQARAHCEEEGGDLIRINSIQKYEIFKEMLGPLANPINIQVWIQTVKVGQIWRFHDGAVLPGFVNIITTNNTQEIHARAKSADNFTCYDAPDEDKYNYMCEYYRQFMFKGTSVG